MLRKSNIPIGASLVIVFVLSINLNIFPQSGFNDGVTLLMCALKKTSNIDVQDVYGWTALAYAAVRGDKKMTKKLLSSGASPDVVDEDGRSILMHAVDYGYKDIVELLIAAKADVNHRDKKGATAMGLAWTKSKDGMVALLENAGAAKLRTEDKRADIYSPLPPHNGPFWLNARDSMGSFLPFASEGVHELKMRVLVDTNGTVRRVRVLIGLPNGGTAAAVKHAYNGRYQPATKNGQSIEAWMDRGLTIRKTMP
jgi:hypothetical protein